MDSLKDTVVRLSDKYFPEIITIRRHIHQHPELSFNELGTSAFIKTKLREYQIPFREGFAKTGIVGIIEGKQKTGKVVALRADMDALPVKELNDIPYISVHEGIMHACGHDVHVASLLGTAKILNTLKDEFSGRVMLIFQPGEEKIPGGASLMIQEGAFNQPAPDLVIAQHVMPGLESGKAGFRSGLSMASADEIYLTIRGKGGHGAMPHQIIDTVLITSHIIVALQQIVSRNANAQIPTVLSFGKIEALGATNVIPSEVKVAGTFRTTDERWRKQAHDRIRELSESIALCMGATCETDIKTGYPCQINDKTVTSKAIAFARNYLGKENVVDMDMRMASEDFAFFSQKFPSTLYRLGISLPDNPEDVSLHSPDFNVDENAMKTGMGTMAWIALSFLREERDNDL